MLEHLLEAESHVGLRAAPFGRVDHALLQRGQDIAAAHGDGGHADVLVDLAGDAGRGAEAELAEIRHAVDGRLEPAERLGPHRLQHEALHVDLHLLPQLVIELLAAAVEEPRDPREVVHAEARARGRGAEEGRGGVLAGPVVRPRESAFDQALVDRIERNVHRDHGARGEHLEGDGVVGEARHVRGELLEHDHLVGRGRDHGLHADLHGLALRLRQRWGEGQDRGRHGRTGNAPSGLDHRDLLHCYGRPGTTAGFHEPAAVGGQRPGTSLPAMK